MKNFSIFLIISLLLSCKGKMSHNDALNYYVIVSLQKKEVTDLVKLFSAKLSRLNQQDSSKRTIGQYDSIKKDYYEVIKQIDNRTLLLDRLESDKNNIYLKNFAMTYLSITRDILVFHVFKI